MTSSYRLEFLVPLNRPALRLGPGPSGVQDARRWVVQACVDLGRPELAECAELGVSELVTNALLHGEAPIQVGLRGTREHPRIEVHDGSTDVPVLPTEPARPEDDDLLLTFGRGLSIVARSSSAWGADIAEDGKVVWFAPAATFVEGAGAEGIVTGDPGTTATSPEPLEDAVRVRLLDVPLNTYLSFQRHFRELRREVRLLALAHHADYPLAQSLADLFTGLDRQLRDSMGMDQIDTALHEGLETADVEVEISRQSTTTMERFLELLDLADEFCRTERLLSLSRDEEQYRFQHWFFGEYVRQGRDEPPRSWAEFRSSTSFCTAS